VTQLTLLDTARLKPQAADILYLLHQHGEVSAYGLKRGRFLAADGSRRIYVDAVSQRVSELNAAGHRVEWATWPEGGLKREHNMAVYRLDRTGHEDLPPGAMFADGGER
jgi:hypothetical protein